ncbi:hypothetical protein [Stenotrophomonas sp. SY1]|uniref:hypothetical protein n=1 Tax=Stenotrophomonas sp. SY1 TaxID=477235 RepID=UPI001E3560E8|nr:hypothetical protein [Stenotrophomonas sp. SY1]MCD9086984.1 hypothetical protein [Stenotrophomonas sp. SY1]
MSISTHRNARAIINDPDRNRPWRHAGPDRPDDAPGKQAPQRERPQRHEDEEEE